MNLNVLAIDIAKMHFQLHGVDKNGGQQLKKALTRKRLVEYVVNLPGDFTIAMEACGGANHWGRTFQELGYKVKLISPQYVKAFLLGSKNDANDAKAIAVAAQTKSIPTVPVKTLEQQNLQTLHKVRDGFVCQRTATSNTIRGFLLEYGLIIPKGLAFLRKQVPEILEDAENNLPDTVRKLIHDLLCQLKKIDACIAGYDKDIKQVAVDNPVCQQFMKLKGIGPIISVLAYSALGDASYFKNGRHCSAYLGLVPKEHSTGGKHKLLGISKRGNSALRGLLIHGARSVLKNIGDKQDKLSVWLRRIKETGGYNKCCVAMANKLARHLWAIMAYGDRYEFKPEMTK